jgi:hypothetical protein
MTDPTSSTQLPKLIKPSCGFPAKWLIQHCPSSCHNAPKSLLCWRSLSYIAYNIFPTIAKTCQRLTFLMNSQVSGRFVIFPTTTNIYHVLDIAFDLLTKTAEPTCSQQMPTTISILSLPLIVLRNGWSNIFPSVGELRSMCVLAAFVLRSCGGLKARLTLEQGENKAYTQPFTCDFTHAGSWLPFVSHDQAWSSAQYIWQPANPHRA